MAFFCFHGRVKTTLNFVCGECCIGSRVRIPEGEVLLAKLAISAGDAAEICAHIRTGLFIFPKVNQTEQAHLGVPVLFDYFGI